MKALSKQDMMEYVATEVGEPVLESFIVNRVGFVKDYAIREVGQMFGDIGANAGIVGGLAGGILGGTFIGAFAEHPGQRHFLPLPDKMLMILTRNTLGLFEYDFGVFRNLIGDLVLLIDRGSITKFKIGSANALLFGTRNINVDLVSGINIELQVAVAYMSKARKIEEALEN